MARTDGLPEKSAADAIVIGAMRAGTTALYRVFLESGLVAVPECKETDFYLSKSNFARGLNWYRKQFGNSDLPWVDFCPNYTKRDMFPGAPARTFENAPNAKLIFIARDPVARAESQYKHTFMHSASLADPADVFDTREGEHILMVSKYAYQLEPYFEHWSKDDILIVDFNDLLDHSSVVFKRIAEHIGLEPSAIERLSNLPEANSGDEIRRMPRWWGQMRDTKMGRYVRSRTPRKLIDSMRAAVKTGKPLQVPEFDDRIRSNLAQKLKTDASRFREITGKSFRSWRV
jgi:Sulfotransferase domain